MKDFFAQDLPIQCLTLDGIALSHVAQVHALCAAGARWIQLRCKDASDREVEKMASASLPVCRRHGVRLIINDRIDVARRVGADGVHLGKFDMPWREARALLRDDFIIGGTVNNVADAELAAASGALDYVGVGPFRDTRTKQNLAPILSADAWREILAVLGTLPSYAIGGIQVDDIAQVRALGVSGAAVCSGLYRQQAVTKNYRAYLDAWNSKDTPADTRLERMD